MYKECDTFVLVVYPVATDLLFGIDSVWVFHSKYFSDEQGVSSLLHTQTFESINKEKESNRTERETENPVESKTFTTTEKQKSTFHTAKESQSEKRA